MSKRFKFKLPRLISSSLQICRSRNLSSFPEHPLPNNPRRTRLSAINPKANGIRSPESLPSMPEDSFVSVKAIQTISCPRRDHEVDSGLDADSIEYSWREDGEWHVVNKRVDHEGCGDQKEGLVIVSRYEKCKGDGAVLGKRDTASVSTRVFSGKYGSNETNSLLSSSIRFWKEGDDEEHGKLASVSVLRRTTSMESSGKVRDSVAVVKRSENPLEDFRTSMIEMVVERRMFEVRDLESLLRCFLSLNSMEYHGIIVEAFSELWQMMFCNDDTPPNSPNEATTTSTISGRA